MKAWFTILILALFGLKTSRAQESSREEMNRWSDATNSIRVTPEFLSQLAEELRTNNPAVQGARWRADAAAANVRTVRTWEDPVARIGGMAARDENRADDGDLIYGVQQRLPLFGKPKAAREMARAEAAAESAKIDVQFQSLRRDLAKAVFRAALADRSVALGYEDLDWLDTLVNSTEARYRNGTASLAELLQTQNERTRRLNQLRTEESQVHHEHVGINRLLNRSASFHWQRFELPEVAGAIPFTSRLLELAFNNEPRLRVMEHDLKTAQASVDAARLARLPDVSIGAQGRNYTGNGDFRSAELMLSFTLPWGNRSKYDAEIRREYAKRTATEYDIDNERKALAEEIHQVMFMIDNARREALLYRDELIPRSRTALDAAHSAWMSGKGTLRDVIDARRMLTESELMHARAIAEQYQALSELVLRCGLADLTALEKIGLREERTTQP
jgi:outer membrane protein TolC